MSQLAADHTCEEGYSWAWVQEALEASLETCPQSWGFWALCSGYDQSAEQIDWEEISVWNWDRLLAAQPQFAEQIDWEEISVWSWDRLLAAQPQLAERRHQEGAI